MSPRRLESTEEEAQRESVIWKFYKEGTISKPIFSLYFKDTSSKTLSKMIIGGYDEAAILARGT